MRLIKKTNPTTLPLSLADARIQARIEASEIAFDPELEMLIRTAGEWVEDVCHLVLITTEFDAVYESFPDGDLKIPAYPVASVISLQYFDEDGVSNTISNYQTQLVQTPCFLRPAPNDEWPRTQENRIDAVKLNFTAGYGAGPDQIPQKVKHLMRLLVAHWFKNKEAVVTGTISKEIELAADNLMKLVRVNEFVEFYQ
jgi:uncharacterized phiE125 gp8 family phage protein